MRNRAILLLAALVAGCNPGPDERADAHQPRSPPPHSVAQAQSQPVADLQKLETVKRGRERYAIFCTPCHGVAGLGDGTAVVRGFPAPPSLRNNRALDPAGIVRIIAEGKGLMLPMAERIAPPDRRAIAAYVKALQLAQDPAEAFR